MAPGRYEWEKTPRIKSPSEDRQLVIPKIKVSSLFRLLVMRSVFVNQSFTCNIASSLYAAHIISLLCFFFSSLLTLPHCVFVKF